MESELTTLVATLIELIKQHEVERAADLLGRAERDAAKASLQARQVAVHSVTLALLTVKRQREAVIAAVRSLPSGERLDAEHRLLPLLDRLFDEEITRLRVEKRGLSRA